MFEYIDKLRKKTEKQRRRFALFTSLSFSLMLFVIWLTVILPQIGSDNNENLAQVKAATPLSNFWGTISGSFSEVKKNFKDTEYAIKNLASSTSYYESQNKKTSESQENTYSIEDTSTSTDTYVDQKQDNSLEESQ